MYSLSTEKNRKKWMNEFSWLEFNDTNLMICKLCYWRAEQNRTVMCSTNKFVKGSSNYQKCFLKDHNLSATQDLTRKSKENVDAQKAGSSFPPRKVVQLIPPASAIATSVQQMNEKDQATVTKLHNIAYYIALHGLPFTQFKHLVKSEKHYNVTFTGVCENESASRNFIIDITEYFFQRDVKKKIEKVNFAAILCDESIDKSITEHEVIYIVDVDLDTDLPVMNFFEITAPENSQDAPGLKEAIISALSRHSLDSAFKKMVFLSSNGASVNSGSN